MSVVNPMSLSERLQAALNQPSLILRCQEVSHLLQEVSSKDAGYVLRVVIESVFGATEDGTMSVQQQQVGGGWGLRIITFTEHRAEFQSMREFLSPHGHLLSLIYRLSHDPFQLLPFPIASLPAKVRTEIQEGNAGPFYTSKIQNLGPGKNPSNILFNAFEFYMFHFGYFLVGSGAQRWNLFWTSVRDALYPTLLEDYLSSYLPCNMNLPPGPPTAPVSPRGVLSPISQRLSSGHPYHPSPHNLSSLVSPIAPSFKSFDYGPTLDGSGIGGLGPHQTSSPLHPSVSPHAQVSTWTSQSLIQVLMEIWINLCVAPPPLTGTHHATPSFMSRQQQQPALSASHPALKDVFVPMGDHVRAVRMMVKHFHYFSNSLKSHQQSPLDPLRRNIWPMCRKSLYFFIKHLFIHWPLDSSFRLVLETWLSYIQPWRYVNYMPLERTVGMSPSESDFMRLVDPKWKCVVAENLLFYTHFFSLLLKRVLRLDLASSKNAQILFRVAKVFSQDNLMSMIQEVEDLLEANQMQKSFLGFVGGALSSPHPHTPMTPFTPGQGGDLGDGQHMSQVITQILRSHILEVERSNYHYVPMFGDAVLSDVSRLLRLSKSAFDTLTAELAENPGAATAGKKESAGWLGSLFKSLFDTPQTREDENSIEEMHKCLSHLEMSMKQFCMMFNVMMPETSLMTSSANNRIMSDSHLGTPEKSRIPDQVHTGTGLRLTDYGRHQMMNGLRRLDLQYEGDPDLKPISTYEFGFLVRILFRLARFINTRYESEIIFSYYRRDFMGSLSRVFITDPQTIYDTQREVEADNPYKKVAKDLPPRISLRTMARHDVHLSWLLVFSIIYLAGFGLWNFIFMFAAPLCCVGVALLAWFRFYYPGPRAGLKLDIGTRKESAAAALQQQ